MPSEPKPTGAVTYEQCPNGGGTRRCKCGICAYCGHAKHSAIHGPLFRETAGSKPYGHEFVEQEPADAQ